jgi:hypothetical protein
MPFPIGDFDGLEGLWHLEGEVLGKALVQDVVVEWVLRGSYLRIHYLPSTVTPLTEEPYEAVAYLGWDPAGGGRPVMYLFDVFGATYPAPGRGDRVGSGGFRFVFDYPQGRFLTDLIPAGAGWRIEQYSVEEDGSPAVFGIKHLRRA